MLVLIPSIVLGVDRWAKSLAETKPPTEFSPAFLFKDILIHDHPKDQNIGIAGCLRQFIISVANPKRMRYGSKTLIITHHTNWLQLAFTGLSTFGGEIRGFNRGEYFPNNARSFSMICEAQVYASDMKLRNLSFGVSCSMNNGMGSTKSNLFQEQVSSLNFWQSFGSVFGGICRNLSRLQRPANQIALSATHYDQQSSKSNQEKIEPPTGIVWWRRGMGCVVLLICALYAIRNGLRDLFNGWKVRGWGWLCWGAICAELAVFTLRWGILL